MANNTKSRDGYIDRVRDGIMEACNDKDVTKLVMAQHEAFVVKSWILDKKVHTAVDELIHTRKAVRMARMAIDKANQNP